MIIEKERIILDEEDWKEIFSLFCSPTQYEIKQVYAQDSGHFWSEVNLNDFHSITGEKRETAVDAWRSVMFYLRSRGFGLTKNGHQVDMSFVDDYICD